MLSLLLCMTFAIPVVSKAIDAAGHQMEDTVPESELPENNAQIQSEQGALQQDVEAEKDDSEKVFYNGQWIELLKQDKTLEKETPIITEENQNELGNQARQSQMLLARSARALIPAGDAKRPQTDFVDVASYQGNLTRANYEHMKKYGVAGVVVKLTEGTSYKNPCARNQINNAKAAGLKVSAYHYSWFTSKEQAEKEADFFAATARELGLDNSTVMVNDAENPVMNNGLATANSIYFALRLIKTHGFNSVIHYSYANWFKTGVLNQTQLGANSVWIANYPNDPLKSNLLHKEATAWQWTSEVVFPEISGIRFDTNVDYSGYFTNGNIKPPVYEEPSGKIKIEDVGNKNTNIRLTYTPEKGANNVRAVKFPVWSDANGQKDLIWHEASLQSNGTWSVVVPIARYKESGLYHVHNYVQSFTTNDSKLNATGTFTIDPVKIAEVKPNKTEATDGKFSVTVKIPSGKAAVTQVRAASWSKSDRSNLHWYSARKSGSDWIIDFDVMNHQNISGEYTMHIYADYENGLQAGAQLRPLVKVSQKSEIDMHRLYNPNSGEHFYTSLPNEKDKLVSLGWKYEGVAWKAPSKGEEVYRLYNPNAGDHHYTKNVAEKDKLVKLGWRYEGVNWYSKPNGEKEKAVLRLYNPNAKKAGAHHYTQDEAEKNKLVKLGWRYEGIGWYAN